MSTPDKVLVLTLITVQSADLDNRFRLTRTYSSTCRHPYHIPVDNNDLSSHIAVRVRHTNVHTLGICARLCTIAATLAPELYTYQYVTSHVIAAELAPEPHGCNCRSIWPLNCTAHLKLIRSEWLQNTCPHATAVYPNQNPNYRSFQMFQSR